MTTTMWWHRWRPDRCARCQRMQRQCATGKASRFYTQLQPYPIRCAQAQQEAGQMFLLFVSFQSPSIQPEYTNVCLQMRLASAYRSACGREPNFTAVGINPGLPHCTVDYIWYTPQARRRPHPCCFQHLCQLIIPAVAASCQCSFGCLARHIQRTGILCSGRQSRHSQRLHTCAQHPSQASMAINSNSTDIPTPRSHLYTDRGCGNQLRGCLRRRMGADCSLVRCCSRRTCQCCSTAGRRRRSPATTFLWWRSTTCSRRREQA